jgi:hypothetical protein
MSDLEKALQHARNVGLTDRDIAVVVRVEADRVRFAQESENVTLVHPELPEISVHPDTVDSYEPGGWTVKQPEPEVAEETPAEPAKKAPAKKTTSKTEEK